MKKSIIVIMGLFVIALGAIALNSSSNIPSQSSALSYAAVQSDVNSGAKLYDVRTAPEYTSGHFKNAENWSLQVLQAGRLPEIPKDTKVYVYCQSGNRSSQTTKILTDAGFTNVVDLGGLRDVQASGGKLE